MLAPCILPLLPVIIGGSLTGDAKGVHMRKVLTIVVSLGISIIAFTLLLKVSTLFIEIPESTWKWISGGIIVILGLIVLFPKLWEGQLVAKISAKSNILLGKGSQKKSFWGDVIIGAALGPVFSTCSPTYFIVLATVLPAQPIVGVGYLLAYVVGLGLSLFIIALVGQKIMSKLNIAADSNGWVKRSLGALFILVGLAIITGYDKKLETAVIDAGFFDVTRVEQRLLELSEPEEPAVTNSILDVVKKSNTPEVMSENEGSAMIAGDGDVMIVRDDEESSAEPVVTVPSKSDLYKLAPEISSPDGFVNTDGQPITLEELRGKVVILEIWTYTCINCQRTIPYLNDWYSKYKDQGLEIVGLHTPEFAFEKLQRNVADAVERFDIEYPVVLDNDYSTWNDYGNRYWPRKYLIDIDGYIVYDHIGEGGYEETERAIQAALTERNERMGMDDVVTDTLINPEDDLTVKAGIKKSPEIYFGSKRNAFLANGKAKVAGEQTLTAPAEPGLNKLYLDGTWNMKAEYAENKTAGEIVFKYNAKRVYFVGGSRYGVDVEIYQDETLLKTIHVEAEQLYELVNDESYGEHVLRMKVLSPGLQAFTFTFG